MEQTSSHSFEIIRKEKELIHFKFKIEKDNVDLTHSDLGNYIRNNFFDEMIDAVEHLITEKLESGDKSDQEDTELTFDLSDYSSDMHDNKFTAFVDWEVGSREEISEARREFNYERLEEIEVTAYVGTSDTDEEIEEQELHVDLDAAFKYVLLDIKSELEKYETLGSYHFYLSGVDYDVNWEMV